MYVTICENCLQWQDPKTGDCHGGCVRRGLALPALMVKVPRRESELCRHRQAQARQHLTPDSGVPRLRQRGGGAGPSLRRCDNA